MPNPPAKLCLPRLCRRRLELLQDFRFNAACQRIKISGDQQYIFASGYHPPQVWVHNSQ